MDPEVPQGATPLKFSRYHGANVTLCDNNVVAKSTYRRAHGQCMLRAPLLNGQSFVLELRGDGVVKLLPFSSVRRARAWLQSDQPMPKECKRFHAKKHFSLNVGIAPDGSWISFDSTAGDKTLFCMAFSNESTLAFDIECGDILMTITDHRNFNVQFDGTYHSRHVKVMSKTASSSAKLLHYNPSSLCCFYGNVLWPKRRIILSLTGSGREKDTGSYVRVCFGLRPPNEGHDDHREKLVEGSLKFPEMVTRKIRLKPHGKLKVVVEVSESGMVVVESPQGRNTLHMNVCHSTIWFEHYKAVLRGWTMPSDREFRSLILPRRHRGDPISSPVRPGGDLRIDPGCDLVCGLDCDPRNGLDSDPRNGLDCDPRNGLDCDPRNGPDCDPRNGLDCDPRNGLDCDPRNGLDCDPRNDLDCDPRNGQDCGTGSCHGEVNLAFEASDEENHDLPHNLDFSPAPTETCSGQTTGKAPERQEAPYASLEDDDGYLKPSCSCTPPLPRRSNLVKRRQFKVHKVDEPKFNDVQVNRQIARAGERVCECEKGNRRERKARRGRSKEKHAHPLQVLENGKGGDSLSTPDPYETPDILVQYREESITRERARDQQCGSYMSCDRNSELTERSHEEKSTGIENNDVPTETIENDNYGYEEIDTSKIPMFDLKRAEI